MSETKHYLMTRVYKDSEGTIKTHSFVPCNPEQMKFIFELWQGAFKYRPDFKITIQKVLIWHNIKYVSCFDFEENEQAEIKNILGIDDITKLINK